MSLQGTAKIIRAFSKALDEAGHVSIETYDVLVTLEYEDGNRMRLSQLADEVVLSRSGLSRLVDRLERQGLLRREASPGDRRGTYAVLTDAGLEARRRAWPTLEAEMKRVWGDALTDAEATRVLRLFAKVRQQNTEKSDGPTRSRAAFPN